MPITTVGALPPNLPYGFGQQTTVEQAARNLLYRGCPFHKKYYHDCKFCQCLKHYNNLTKLEKQVRSDLFLLIYQQYI